MPFLLLFLFLAYPLLEIALLIRVGGLIGVLPTILLILATAVLGLATLQRQGLVVMRRAADAMMEGRPPVEPVLEGALFGFAGFLLIVPGLISDAIGLALLIPPVRHLIARTITRSLVTVSGVDADVRSETDRGPRASSNGPVVIEGEFTRVDEQPMAPDDERRTGSGKNNDRT
jgi:UPF0716 protein FxsA